MPEAWQPNAQERRSVVLARKILTTGGDGFIGSSLLAQLDALGGYQVVVLDSEVSGTRAAIADCSCDFVAGNISHARKSLGSDLRLPLGEEWQDRGNGLLQIAADLVSDVSLRRL